MRSLSAASAAILGSLALAVPASAAAPQSSAAAVQSSAAAVQSGFVTHADGLCQSYFSAVKRADATIAARTGDASSGASEILETAELLHTNALLSLSTEALLAELAAPRADTALWAASLDADRTGGLLTLETSDVLAKLLLSQTAANAAVSSHTSAYEKVERAWDSGAAALGITGCE